MKIRLISIDRLSAWALFIGMLIYFITGYGMAKGIINPSLSSKLHMGILNVVILVAFTIHAWYAIHTAFKRWRIWSPASKAILAIFFIGFLSAFIYIDRFYTKNPSQKTAATTESTNLASSSASSVSKDETGDDISETPSSSSTSNSSVASETVSTNANTLPSFTSSELAKYDGLDGQPAYVAIDGNVYDMTTEFRNGLHYGYEAGVDQTDAFYAEHSASLLSGFEIVGTFNP